MRKHLVKSAGFWFRAAKSPDNGVLSHDERLMAMESAYNHVESALAYILENCPEANELFDKTQNK